MDSVTKTRLTEDQMRALVARAFGPGTNAEAWEELTEGYFSAAYSLRLSDGQEAVLKVAPSPDVRVMRYEQDIMSSEVEVMRMLYQLGIVPVPRVLYHDTSRDIVGSEYFVMARLPGQPYSRIKRSLSPEDQQSVEEALGRMNRLINEVAGPAFGYYANGQPRYSRWSEAFLEMLSGVLLDGSEAGVALPISADEVIALARESVEALDRVTEPRLVHWDLWDGNVFVDDDLKITGLIDFERALWGDPLMEVYFSPLFNSRAFRRGYGPSCEGTRDGDLRRSLYTVYVRLIMIIECTYRKYPTQDQERWCRAELPKDFENLKQLCG